MNRSFRSWSGIARQKLSAILALEYCIMIYKSGVLEPIADSLKEGSIMDTTTIIIAVVCFIAMGFAAVVSYRR